MRYIKTVQGVPVTYFFPEDAVLAAMSYEPRAGDIFVTTYPKCGTTWVQYIAYGIFYDCAPPTELSQFFAASPFLELFGVDAVENMSKPGTIKTHLPFEEKRFSPHSKYIYVARNPYDVCVSAYHHLQTQTAAEDEHVVPFDEHIKRFVSGRNSYGCYLKGSLIPWYTRRHESNVLFLTYEELHDDIKMQVKKIAEFLGPEYGRRVSRDPSMLQRVVEMTSKESMRPLFKNFLMANIELAAQYQKQKNALVPQELEDTLKFLQNRPLRHEFVRQGSVGGYKSFLSENHRRTLEEWISASTHGSDVMCLWPNVALP
ncbi:sulfotransferase 1A1-like [Dermacentor andersoni]|uniref:sulfotransferase 1A1-like n=1 Tax=Dermacentor andersoni TaxID=34620 RepID=UPI002155E72E|nr:sulfotransferase 1 family member D1-like [Dermacentor andersoni]